MRRVRLLYNSLPEGGTFLIVSKAAAPGNGTDSLYPMECILHPISAADAFIWNALLTAPGCPPSASAAQSLCLPTSSDPPQRPPTATPHRRRSPRRQTCRELGAHMHDRFAHDLHMVHGREVRLCIGFPGPATGACLGTAAVTFMCGA